MLGSGSHIFSPRKAWASVLCALSPFGAAIVALWWMLSRRHGGRGRGEVFTRAWRRQWYCQAASRRCSERDEWMQMSWSSYGTREYGDLKRLLDLELRECDGRPHLLSTSELRGFDADLIKTTCSLCSAIDVGTKKR
jgi:hypothetical protein